MDFLEKGRVIWFQSLFRELTLCYKIRNRFLGRVDHLSLLICYPYSVDFNLIEYLLLDRQGGNTNNTLMLGLCFLTQRKQKNNLINSWWKENSGKRLFTFHNYNHSIHSRIDRFYINKNQKIENISIFPKNLSDQRLVKMQASRRSVKAH